MFTSVLLAVTPRVADWSPTVGLIMILCNVLAIAIAKFTIKNPNVGLQLPSPQLFGGLSHGAMLGATSFGHVLGAGVILGLSNMGVI